MAIFTEKIHEEKFEKEKRPNLIIYNLDFDCETVC